jgi:hypothetical protein
MICFAKPVLTDSLCIVQKEHIICPILTFDEKSSIFIGDNPIFSSERMLHKDYDRNGSVEKKFWSWGSKRLHAKTN